MNLAPSFLLGLALLGLGLSAPAQTSPASQPKTRPGKGAPRPTGPAAQKRTAYATPFFKDTAAFRRSGRPADKIPIPAQPKQ